MPDVPARTIDREALERILQRAAELQAAEIDTSEGLTEQELLKLGAEVGIDGRFLRQAMYEERAGAATSERGALARWFGPGHVVASRVVPGDRSQVEQAIEQWMSDSEALAVKRRMPDRTLWERQRGFLAEMKRGFGVGGREYRLARAQEISVAVTQLEPGYCHVELSADITNSRRGVAAGSVTMASAGAVGAMVASAVAAPLFVPVVIITMCGAGAIGISRAHTGTAERTLLALEQVLDRLERGEIKPKHQLTPPSPLFALGKLADEVRKAIADGMQSGRRPRHRLPGP